MTRAPSLQCLLYLRSALSSGSAGHSRKARCIRIRDICTKLSRPRAYSQSAVVGIADQQWSDPIEVLSNANDRVDDFKDERIRHLREQNSLPVGELQKQTERNIYTHLRRCHKLALYQISIELFEKYYDQDKPWREYVLPASLNYYILAKTRLGHSKGVIETILKDFVIQPERRSYDVSTANILLQHLITQHKFLKAHRMLETLHDRKFPLDSISYNTVLQGARAGSADVEQLNRILTLMTTRQVPRDNITINIIIAAYCQVQNVEKARWFLDKAISIGLVNASSFNTLINHYTRRDDWQSAMNMLQDMKDREIKRDETSYTPFLRLLTQKSDPAEVAHFFKLMEDDNIRISSPSFNTLLYKLLATEAYEAAGQLLDIMESKRLDSSRTFNTILDFYLAGKSTFLKHPLHHRLSLFYTRRIKESPELLGYRSVKALQSMHVVWERLKKSERSMPLYTNKLDDRDGKDLVAETKYISIMIRSDLWQKAVERYQLILSRGISPPVQMFVVVFAGLLRHREYRVARKLANRMNPDLLRRSLPFQTTLLAAISTSTVVDDIRHTIKLLQSLNFKFDVIFYTAAAWRLYRATEYHEALSLLRYAYGLGIFAFDLVAWVIMLECYSRTQDIRGTIWCLQTMKENKIILDRQARRRAKRIVKKFEQEADSQDIILAQEALKSLQSQPISITEDKLWELDEDIRLSRLRYAGVEAEAQDSGASEAYLDGHVIEASSLSSRP